MTLRPADLPMRRSPTLLLILALGALVVVGLLALVLSVRPTWSVERVRHVVVTTLQSEGPASDLVTGRIGVSARGEIEDRGRFSWVPAWVGIPGVNLVGADVRVEIAGEALYGFDVRLLQSEMITLTDDGFVQIELPPLRVVAVEPDLARLQLRTREGLFRRGAAAPLQTEAMRDVQQALREQGEAHLRNSSQPAINTGNALAAALRPAFESAGFRDPRFRFVIDESIILEPAGTAQGIEGRSAARP